MPLAVGPPTLVAPCDLNGLPQQPARANFAEAMKANVIKPNIHALFIGLPLLCQVRRPGPERSPG
jgi:hypothetical protein